MIIARAPLRISFFGGGTDNAEFIRQFGFGMVLGVTINRYVYVFLDDQPSFEKSKFKFAYRAVEEVDRPEDFLHPVVKAMLTDLQISRPLNIATMAHLPGRSGLGSSSAFTVALYSALCRLQRKNFDRLEIAKYAVHCERNLMGESGGFQDQYHSAFGGLRSYRFTPKAVEISEPLIREEALRYLEKSIVLIATISSRESRFHAQEWNEKLSREKDIEHVLEIRELCRRAVHRLTESDSKEKILDLLIENTALGWDKKKLVITNLDDEVNQIIERGLANGAAAAKLCGAGGSGFVLFLAKPERIQKLRDSFPASQVVTPLFDSQGVQVNEL